MWPHSNGAQRAAPNGHAGALAACPLLRGPGWDAARNLKMSHCGLNKPTFYPNWPSSNHHRRIQAKTAGARAGKRQAVRGQPFEGLRFGPNPFQTWHLQKMGYPAVSALDSFIPLLHSVKNQDGASVDPIQERSPVRLPRED
jgi:hypothetical protein